jgi:hypothetical protein
MKLRESIWGAARLIGVDIRAGAAREDDLFCNGTRQDRGMA